MNSVTNRLILRCGLLILVVAAVYCSTLKHGFVWDDGDIIVTNPLLEKLSNIPRFFLAEDTIEGSTGYYRPITYISFALDRALWGTNPTGFHLTNLILHMAVVLLLYRVIAALFRRENLALIAALLFSLHPLTVETVNFLSGGRNTLLSAAFALLSLLCYIRNRQLMAVIFFTLAIFSKEFALLLPVIFFLYDWRLRKNGIRYRIHIPYLIAVALYLTLRSLAVQSANFLSSINVFHALASPYLVARYALNMILPLQLQIIYDIHPRLPIILFCIVLLGLLLTAIYLLRRRDELFLPLCWFLLFLLPVINIIPLNSTSLMADRYAYFSLMGFVILLAGMVCRGKGRSGAVMTVLLLTFYAAVDLGRNRLWGDELSLFTGMTVEAPNKFIGFRNLGLYYYRKGDIPRAVHNLEAAGAKPDNNGNFLIGDAYIFWKENMPEKAEKALLRALDENPGNTELHLLLMMLAQQRGDSVGAREYRATLEGMVGDVEGVLKSRAMELCRMGELYTTKRQYLRAEIYLWQAFQIDPGYVPALIDMGSLRAELGAGDEAVRYLKRALALEPSNASAHHNLALVYRMQGLQAESALEMDRYREAEAVSKAKGSSSGQ